MASRKTLGDLPVELFLQVISDETLTKRDWKALRAACPSWAQHITHLLYRRISVSRLKEDWRKFWEIVNTPHLAQHVQQLVWYELSLEFWVSQLEADDPMACLMDEAASDADLFWLPRIPRSRTAITETFSPNIKNYMKSFRQALKLMPRLNTFISCSMPGDHIFHYRGYPLQADLYLNNGDSSSISASYGFFRFMLPILSRHPNIISSLYWADQGTRPNPLTDPYLLARNLYAFSALTSIDICSSSFAKIGLASLALCLNEAKGLRDISLCFERTSSESGMFMMLLIDVCDCHWTSLTSLKLVGMTLPIEFLGRFCRQHSQTLRHLTLDICQVTVFHLIELRGSPSLQLESITIRSDNDEFTQFESQEHILPFVNMTAPHIIGSDGKPIDHDSQEELRTEVSIYDHHTCGTAAYFDSNYEPFNEAYYNTDLMDISGDQDSDDDDDFEDRQEKTYWAWGRKGVFQSDTYYWQVDSAELADAETTFWVFTNRDGFTAFGEDPLEYFSDWDSSAGDVATPTPYCEQLHRYSIMPWWDITQVRHPPPSAEYYDPYSNPWVDYIEEM